MRVLIIQPWISFRGSETVSVRLCEALNKLGNQSEIACLFLDETRLPEGAEKLDYILPSKFWQYLLMKNKLAFYTFGFPVLAYIVLKNVKRFDILNPHNPPSLWVAQIAKILTGKKLVWNIHNIFPMQNPILVDEIIVPTKKIAKIVKDRFRREAIVIYNGV